MGWLKLDDRYAEHHKIRRAGPMASMLDVRGMLYCAAWETDGFIAADVLPTLTGDMTGGKRLAAKLVEVCRWEWDEDRQGWWVHDYTVYNPTHEQRDADRAAAAERMAKVRGVVRPNSGRTNTRGSGQVQPPPTPTPKEEPNGSSSRRKAAQKFGTEAATLAKAEWDRRDRKPVTRFPALAERVQDALDAGHPPEAVAEAMRGMTVFTRDAFDFALNGKSNGQSKQARSLALLEQMAQEAQ